MNLFLKSVSFLFVYFSTVSSAINSIIAVVIEDLLEPLYDGLNIRRPKQYHSLWIAKGIGKVNA